MKRLFVVLLAVFLAYRPVYGASIEYCGPYAANTMDLLLNYMRSLAYTSCLNSEDDPVIAKTPHDALQTIVPLELLLPRRPEKVPVEPPPAPVGRSGYAVNTREWIAYCKKYWPASFDRKSGTVIKTGHKRVPCPG